MKKETSADASRRSRVRRRETIAGVLNELPIGTYIVWQVKEKCDRLLHSEVKEIQLSRIMNDDERFRKVDMKEFRKFKM